MFSKMELYRSSVRVYVNIYTITISGKWQLAVLALCRWFTILKQQWLSVHIREVGAI